MKDALTEAIIRPIEGTNLILYCKPPQQFKAGDVVVLKSGGPRMTVVKCNSETVEVQWFTKRVLNATIQPINAVELIKEAKDASV